MCGGELGVDIVLLLHHVNHSQAGESWQELEMLHRSAEIWRCTLTFAFRCITWPASGCGTSAIVWRWMESCAARSGRVLSTA